MFENLAWLAEHKLKATADAYDLVYAGKINNCDYPLEELWRTFNLHHPADYRGRSMSVSDVVVLHDKEEAKTFFCDSIGWKEIIGFTGEWKIQKGAAGELHVCPNHCEALFTTTTHVVQTWKVDALGNIVEEVSSDEVIAGPDNGNIWECEECGTEAELVECAQFSILVDGKVLGSLYLPVTPRGCAYWIFHGMSAVEYIPIVPDARDIPTLTVEGKVYYLSEFLGK